MIYGVNPISYNDYPKEISYVIFLGGCNFRCPFCHNNSIVSKVSNEISIEKIVSDLNARKYFIKAVVITGGEPTLYNDKLIDLIKIIKKMNFKIKLDTNGTNISLLKKIINEKLVDYIAMDIKNTFSKYEKTIGCKTNINIIKKSIALIENSEIDYEFRTTISKFYHSIEDIQEIASYIKNKERYFLQNYEYNKEQIIKNNFGSFSKEELEDIKEKLDLLVKI